MQIWKPCDKKWRHNDIITKNNRKQWKNTDLYETKQIIYHSKGNDESYPKMYFLLNLWALLSNFWHFLQCLLTKYGRVTWPKKEISKNFYVFLILHLILGKVTKFIAEKPSTSEVISQKPHWGWKTPPSAFMVNSFRQLVCTRTPILYSPGDVSKL